MGQRIAIFDYQVTPTNPVGGCHRRMLEGLCRDHEFTVYAVEFDNPCPERIRWVRIPAPKRPLALLFVTFHLLAPIVFAVNRVRHRARYDVVQFVESNLAFGDVSSTQFCHRAYLRRHWTASKPPGLRGALRWLDHRLHAFVEPWVFGRARWITVPAQGLARELAEEYPRTRGKIRVIPNPVDVERLRPTTSFDRAATRRRLGIGPDDVALVFVALGHFERKGLPLLLEALRRLDDPRIKLLVVGGASDLVTSYQGKARGMGLGDRVNFVGSQQDIRPYLWAADAFAFPSHYETFSLVTFQAAAAGLPLIVSHLYGVEEILNDGVNGILVGRSVDGVCLGIERFLSLSQQQRQAMGRRAQQDVQGHAPDRFVTAYRTFYKDLRVCRDVD